MKNSANTIDVSRNTFRRGDRVVVATLDGVRVRRVVWDNAPGLVYACTEAVFARLSGGAAAAMPVAFPIEDVEPAEGLPA